MSALTEVDAVVLDALARLQLLARRSGATIEFRNASAELVRMVEGAGLADALTLVEPGPDSGVEVDRQIEAREERGVDEEVHRGDGAV